MNEKNLICVLTIRGPPKAFEFVKISNSRIKF